MHNSRATRLVVAFLRVTMLALLIGVSTQAQQPSSDSATSTSAPSGVTQDPQATSVLNQALTAAGGTNIIGEISDYVGTGNITYDPAGQEQTQGTVTVRGSRGSDFRIDATLPTGTRSYAVHQGIVNVKTESGGLIALTPWANAPGRVAFPYQTPLFPMSLIFPAKQLISILSLTDVYGLSYKGTTQVDGHMVNDVLVTERIGPASSTVQSSIPPRTREIFVDTSTSQIVMMREPIPVGVLHEVHYSNYQAVGGVLMPFTITEDIGGQPSWTINLAQITFNNSLQPSAFVLQ